MLEAVEGRGQLLGWDLDADGTRRALLYAEIGGYIQMDGKEVFRRAVRIMVDSAEKSMNARRRAPPTTSRSSCPTRPTSASSRRPATASASPMDRAAVVLDRTGNTSSASIPLALADALDNGRVADGDLVLLVGFGAGMTAASAVLRWGGGDD